MRVFARSLKTKKKILFYEVCEVGCILNKRATRQVQFANCNRKLQSQNAIGLMQIAKYARQRPAILGNKAVFS